MLKILLALRVWGHMWQHKKIMFKIDNLAVVTVYNTGYTRCKHLAAIIRNIWLVTATWGTEINVTYIPGKLNNIADLLSRWDNKTNKQSQLTS